jgi:hydrogenase-4 component B
VTPGWLLLSAAGLVAGGGALASRARAWSVATLVASVFALAAAVEVLANGQAWEWRSRVVLGGAPVHLLLDALSAFFLVVVAVVGGAGALYGTGYWSDAEHPRSAPGGRRWWSTLLLAMALVLVAADGVHFLVAWELFAVSAYFLITRERDRAEVRDAGWLYLVASHGGTLLLVAFFASLAARTGSWDLGPMRERPELAPLLWLALVGFGVKAGFFPLHVWLPSAHANAPSHVSALMSGVALKMGVYGLVRFSGWLPAPAGAGWAIAGVGTASAVLGVAFALGQHDLKRLLAYHSVENVGIILLGLGFAVVAAGHGDAPWGRLALAGALLHVWNHALFKSLLFFGAGSVVRATGTREMSRLGGLWRAMPWTTSTFTLGAAAIAGLPPLNGFVSEWLVYLGLFGAAMGPPGVAWAAVPAVVLLAVTGAMALACFVKVCGVVFLGSPRTPEAERAQECGSSMRASMLFLAAACAAIGLAPVLVWPALAHASAAWHPVWSVGAAPVALARLTAAHLTLALVALAAVAALRRRLALTGVRRAVTWDCGYVAPTPRMQYTAGSFAATLTGWLAWILRPARHVEPPRGIFPTRAHHRVHTPEVVLERVVAPAAGVVMAAAAAIRRVQHGRVQFYVLYLVVGLAAVTALVLLGSWP